MDALEQYRIWVARHAARATGQDGRQPRLLAGQMRAAGLEIDLRELPADSSHFAPQDTTSMLDIDGLDGASPLG